MRKDRAFAPGHPVIFWAFIVVFIFAAYSGFVAAYDVDKCQGVGNGEKHWDFWPPGWVCGPG